MFLLYYLSPFDSHMRTEDNIQSRTVAPSLSYRSFLTWELQINAVSF